MKKKTRSLLLSFFAALFLVSGGLFLHQTLQYRQGQSVYDEAARLARVPAFETMQSDASFVTLEEPTVPLAALPEEIAAEAPVESVQEEVVRVDPYADALAAMDFTALQAANEDVFGWIVIPGTRLSYPLVQGEDNEYYLNHTWRKGRNSVGAIFMDYRVNRNLSDFHTVIYGHRMNDRSMFVLLLRYKDPTYYEANPVIYIADESGSHAYEIFSAYEANSMATYMLDADFESDGERLSFLDYCKSMSVIETDVEPSLEDRILTLSTCTGNGHDTRWVVQAVHKG